MKQKGWIIAAVIRWHWKNMKQLETWGIRRPSFRLASIIVRDWDARQI